ncbi:MAG TPA: CAP domain-containing protein [Azospirillaceae bacterium]|nr:CAP domain-containing protein [Azospirillaceae bacterium]
MTQLTTHEQYLLELTNRARLDPLSEASRLGIDLNQGITGTPITTDAKPPLAPNPLLNDAARAHSQWMIDTDTFSHIGIDGTNAGMRMAAAGYQFAGNGLWGENLAAWASTGTLDLARAVATEHDGLFRSPGHRLNTLDESFREIGVGIVTGPYRDATGVMATEVFARGSAASFLTGVAFTDADGNGFYTPGEGRNGIRVVLDGGGPQADTRPAGGWVLAPSPGSHTVTFSDGGLPARVGVVLTVPPEPISIKLDLIGIGTVHASTSAALGVNARNLTLLGTADLNGTGNSLDNTVSGNRGDNRLTGGGGSDRLTGGEGADRFIVRSLAEAGDLILDFSAGTGDSLDLRPLFDTLGYQGDDPLADGHLHLTQQGADVLIQVDTNGDGDAFTEVATLANTAVSILDPDAVLA